MAEADTHARMLMQVRGGGGAADGRDGGAGLVGVQRVGGAGGGEPGGGEAVPEGVPGGAGAPQRPHSAQPRGRQTLQRRARHHQAHPRTTIVIEDVININRSVA
uniref:Uncharacterized protein n=1 Tax=Arundo donax TaxID=35708 RepID=A0A0A8YXF3_ARUDO